MDIDKIKNKEKKEHEEIKFYGEKLPKSCNFCSHTKLSDLNYPIEKMNKLFMNEF